MKITMKHSIQQILDSYPQSIDIFKKHGIDVDDHCLFSVRHLPIEECTDLCGVDALGELIEILNSSLNDDITVQSLGELVAQKPLRAKVFDEFGLDFCCGGKQTLEEACRKKNINLSKVLKRIAEDEYTNDAEDQWNESSLAKLIDNIESTHHAYLKKELPRLSGLADKVAKVHGERAPQMVELSQVFRQLKEEIEQHTMKEEMVLFPYIKQLENRESQSTPPFGTVANPIRCMESEHDDAGQALFKMRELTNEYSPPEDACGSWKALLGGLAHLDKDLRTHIHKESSILFPKALQLEEQVFSR